MSKPLQDAYIVAATRLPVGKRNGLFAQTRPDDLLAHALSALVAQAPVLDPALIEDVIVGCAMPEAEQGMNVARMSLLLAGLPNNVPGITINRFCASGLQAIAMAADRIRLGEADVMVAAGVETMSRFASMTGNSSAINPAIFENREQYALAFGMGLTAEKVAHQWKISREDQDAFALLSHQKALAAINTEQFKSEISPYTIKTRVPDLTSGEIKLESRLAAQDEGPRADTSLEKLQQLKPAFLHQGSVTAGNSAQMSDGAAALLLVSENVLKRHKLQALARFVGYTVVGVAPELMGIGPIKAISLLCQKTGIGQESIDWFEINEAFAAQTLAITRTLDIDPDKVNPLGGAIALGHPLGASGAIRATTLIHGLQRRQKRYGVVALCVGSGMGVAALFEMLH
ncbi:MAG: acetyl-CoA C-acyltransferase [Pseudomonadota bacterium]